MNCLLMRELSVKNIVRMWDTYLVRGALSLSLSRAGPRWLTRRACATQAEGGDAFSEFHLYVCLAFLVRWSDTLREMDFQVRARPSRSSGPIRLRQRRG